MAQYVETYTFGFKADTSLAKAAIEDLKASLNKLSSTPNYTFSPNSIKEGVKAADELKLHLEKAINPKTGKLDLSKFNASLKASGLTLTHYREKLVGMGTDGVLTFLNLSKSIATADMSTLNLNTKVAGLLDSLKKVAQYLISTKVYGAFVSSFQQAYNYSKELDKNLNNIRIVTGLSKDLMAEFAVLANKSAKALATTTNEYTKASLIYYQQGLSDKAVKERTDLIVKMANVTGDSALQVSDQMTAIWNNFDNGSLKLSHFGDAITALGAATASSTSEISASLEKFAAAAETVKLSYDYATAAVATNVAATRESAETVGTAFKSIFARLASLQQGETLEDGVGLTKYSEALQKVGVSILDTTGNIRDMDSILDDLGSKWGLINESLKIALANTVAGQRLYSQFMALLNNYDLFKVNVDIALNSDGTLEEQQKIYEESWQAASNRVRANLESIYNDLVDDDFFIGITNGLAKVIEFVDDLIKSAGGLKTILLTISAIITQKMAKEMPNMLSSLANGFMNIVNPNHLAKLVAKLLQETLDNLQKIRTDPMTSQAQKAEAESLLNMSKATESLTLNLNNLTKAEQELAKLALVSAENLGKEAAEAQKLADTLSKTLTTTISTFTRKADFQKVADAFSLTLYTPENLDAALQRSAITKYKTDHNIAIKLSMHYKEILNSNDTNVKQWLADYVTNLNNTKAGGLSSNNQKIFNDIQRAARQQTVNGYHITNKQKASNIATLVNEAALDYSLKYGLAVTMQKKMLGVDNHGNVNAKRTLQGGILYSIRGARLTGQDMQTQLQQIEKILQEQNADTDEIKKILELYIKAGKDDIESLVSALRQHVNTNVDNVTAEIDLFANAAEGAGIVTEGLAQDIREVGTESETSSNSLKRLAELLKNLGVHIPTMSEGITSLSGAVMMVSSGINMLTSSFLALFDETSTPLQRISAAMTLLVSGILVANGVMEASQAVTAITSGMNVLYARTVAKMTDELIKDAIAAGTLAELLDKLGIAALLAAIKTKIHTAGLKKLGIQAGKTALKIAAITLAIMAIIKSFKAIKKMYEEYEDIKKSEEIKLNNLIASYESLSNEYEKVALAQEKLQDGFSKYDLGIENIKKLVQGTKEWKNAIYEANVQAIDLINNNSDLIEASDYYTDSNGLIRIDSQVEKRALQIKEEEVRQSQMLANLTKALANVLQTKKSAQDDYNTNENRSTSNDNLATRGKIAGYTVGALGATASAIILGTGKIGAAIGTLIPIPGIGTLIGAALGASLGALAANLMIGNAKEAEEKNLEAYQKLVEAGAENYNNVKDDNAILKTLERLGYDKNSDIAQAMVAMKDSILENSRELHTNNLALDNANILAMRQNLDGNKKILATELAELIAKLTGSNLKNLTDLIKENTTVNDVYDAKKLLQEVYGEKNVTNVTRSTDGKSYSFLTYNEDGVLSEETTLSTDAIIQNYATKVANKTMTELSDKLVDIANKQGNNAAKNLILSGNLFGLKMSEISDTNSVNLDLSPEDKDTILLTSLGISFDNLEDKETLQNTLINKFGKALDEIKGESITGLLDLLIEEYRIKAEENLNLWKKSGKINFANGTHMLAQLAIDIYKSVLKTSALTSEDNRGNILNSLGELSKGLNKLQLQQFSTIVANTDWTKGEEALDDFRVLIKNAGLAISDTNPEFEKLENSLKNIAVSSVNNTLDTMLEKLKEIKTILKELSFGSAIDEETYLKLININSDYISKFLRTEDGEVFVGTDKESKQMLRDLRQAEFKKLKDNAVKYEQDLEILNKKEIDFNNQEEKTILLNSINDQWGIDNDYEEMQASADLLLKIAEELGEENFEALTGIDYGLAIKASETVGKHIDNEDSEKLTYWLDKVLSVAYNAINTGKTNFDAGLSDPDKAREIMVSGAETLDDAMIELGAKQTLAKVSDTTYSLLAGKEAQALGVDVKTFKEYIKVLLQSTEKLKDNAKAANSVALANIKYSKGLKDLNSLEKDLIKYLDKKYSGTTELTLALVSVQEALSNLLNVSKDNLSNNFILQNAELIRQASKGNIAAIEELRLKLTEYMLETSKMSEVQKNVIKDGYLELQNQHLELGEDAELSEKFLSTISAMYEQGEEVAQFLDDLFGALGFSLKLNEGKLAGLVYNGDANNAVLALDEKSKKKNSDLERYHEINRELAQTEKHLNDIEKRADKAFGQDKINLLSQALDDTNKKYALLSEKEREANAYFAQDLKKLQELGLGFLFSDSGEILNYASIMQGLNASFNSGSIDDEFYEKVTKAISLYEDSLSTLNDVTTQKLEIELARIGKELEIVDYRVLVTVELSEFKNLNLDYIKKLLLDNLNYNTAELIENTLQQFKNNMSNRKAREEGIIGTLYTITNDNGDRLTNSLIQDFLNNGNVSLLDNYNLTAELFESLKKYSEEMRKDRDEIIASMDEIVEHINSVFDTWIERIDEGVANLNKISEEITYFNDLIDLAADIGIKNETRLVRLVLSQGQIQVGKNTALATQALEQSAKSIYDKAEKNYQEALSNGIEGTELLELKKIRDKAQELWDTSLQEAREASTAYLLAIKDDYTNTLNDIADVFSEKMAGIYGSILLMSDNFEALKEINSLFLQDYEKYHHLNKVNYDINKKLSDLNKQSIKNTQRLLDLQAEINKRLQDKNKMTQTEVDILLRKYDLAVAEIALEEAQKAKSQVRMTRDSEGNWGYMYVLDESAIDEAQQQAADAWFNNVSANRLAIQDEQQKIISANQEYEEEMRKSLEDYGGDEIAMNLAREAVYAKVMTTTKSSTLSISSLLADNKNLISWGLEFEKTTGIVLGDFDSIETGWNDVYLALSANVSSAEELFNHYQTITDEAKLKSINATNDYKDLTKGALTNLGLSYENLYTQITDEISNEETGLIKQSENLATLVIADAESMKTELEEAMPAAKASLHEMGTELKDCDDKTIAWTSSIKKLLTQWSELEEAESITKKIDIYETVHRLIIEDNDGSKNGNGDGNPQIPNWVAFSKVIYDKNNPDKILGYEANGNFYDAGENFNVRNGEIDLNTVTKSTSFERGKGKDSNKIYYGGKETGYSNADYWREDSRLGLVINDPSELTKKEYNEKLKAVTNNNNNFKDLDDDDKIKWTKEAFGITEPETFKEILTIAHDKIRHLHNAPGGKLEPVPIWYVIDEKGKSYYVARDHIESIDTKTQTVKVDPTYLEESELEAYKEYYKSLGYQPFIYLPTYTAEYAYWGFSYVKDNHTYSDKIGDNIYYFAKQSDIDSYITNLIDGLIQTILKPDDIIKNLFITNKNGKTAPYGFDTGGYTGNWTDGSGKLAVLHSKEIVLNADDTENLLKMVEAERNYVSSLQGSSEKSTNSLIIQALFNLFKASAQYQKTLIETLPSTLFAVKVNNIEDSIINRIFNQLLKSTNKVQDSLTNITKIGESVVQKLDLIVNIQAEFPAVVEARQIELALSEMGILASLYAYRN